MPETYSARALDPSNRIPIVSWKYKPGDQKQASDPAFPAVDWAELEPGNYVPVSSRAKQTVVWLRGELQVPSGQDPSQLSLDLGARTGHSEVWVNGVKAKVSAVRNAPVFVAAPAGLRAGRNVVAIKLTFGNHVGGVRWSGEPGAGREAARQRGFVTRRFRSKLDGSEQSLGVYLPQCADLGVARPLVVALPGWDGNIYGFSHSRLMFEAERRGWIVLVPDPRGNLLYTGMSEQGVLEAIDVLSSDLRVDPDRVYLTGVSMGGAGALQIGYHYPDRFAALAAFYGDSRYEPRGYVEPILRDQATADRYSVLLFPMNARNLPVLLVHARDDRVSPFVQSQQLAEADRRAGLSHHRLTAPSTGGHSLQVVEDAIDEMVELFASSQRIARPPRVSFKTSAAAYSRAWWLQVQVRREGEFAEADVSVDPQSATVRVHSMEAKAVTVQLEAALGAVPAKVSIVVDQKTRAPLFLRGVSSWSAAVVSSAGREAPIAVRAGVLELAALQPGTYELHAAAR